MLARALAPRKALDTRLIRRRAESGAAPSTVVVPGILGSELLRPDGSRAWLNMGNAFGYHDLALPLKVPLSECRDNLVPRGLLGTFAVLPRLFGFTEYADLTDLLLEGGVRHHVLAYDWRRDLVESARRLDDMLESLAEAEDNPDARFNVVGHSMGGLIARYYLRFGRAEPDENAPVTWAGARRIRTLVLVATPNGGGIPALDAILHGNRVGLSSTTLAATVIATMPAIYQLLPPDGAGGLLDHRCDPLAVDLHDAATWERFGWGPFATPRARRGTAGFEIGSEEHRAFLCAVLQRARTVHRALGRPALTPCPSRVVLLGGDCLPTTARAIVPERRGSLPRFDPWTRAEAEAMLEAGDGRVTRASVLASHLPGSDDSDAGCGLPEVGQAFFGNADHHGVYGEPTFQSIILRLLLRPASPSASVAASTSPE